MGNNPNSMSIQAVWDAVYQITHYKQPVFKAIAVERLTGKLKKGDTVHRAYSSDFVVNDMGDDGSYQSQGLTDTDETLVVNAKKEVTFTIPEWQEVQFQLPVRMKYARKAMNRLFNQIDGDILGAVSSGASTAIDDGTLGGTAGNGISVTAGNVSQLFYSAIQQLQLNNVMYDPNAMFSGDVKLDKTKILPIAIISPQVYNLLLQFLGGKNSVLGDKVSSNGHAGVFAGFNLFVSNNLQWETTLNMSVNPTDGDTITINTVTLTFKTTVDAGVTAGQTKVASTATLTNTNLKNFLNAPTTTVADATNAGYNALSTANANLLKNLTATNPTGTTTKIVMKGYGTVVVSSSFTSGTNTFTAAKQIQHCIFGVSQSIDLVIQKTPNLKLNPVSGKVAMDFVTWTLYGYKVFKEQAPQIIDCQIQSSSFTAPSNTFN